MSEWTDRVLLNYQKHPYQDSEAVQGTCTGLIQTSELMLTIIEKMEPIFQPFSDDHHIHHSNLSTVSTATTTIRPPTASILHTKNNDTMTKTRDDFLKTLVETLKKLQDFCGTLPVTAIDRRVADAVLQYVLILLPSYLPVSVLLDSYKVSDSYCRTYVFSLFILKY